MTTPNDPTQLHAFVDAELDLTTQLEIEARLETEASLRQRIDEIRETRSAVREHAEYHAAPDSLRQRLASAMLPAPTPVTARAPAVMRAPRPELGARGVPAWLQRWLGWRPLAAARSVVAVLAVALDLASLTSSRDERLAQEVVASHVRSTLGQHLVDVASSDNHTVKPFLSARLGFSPPVEALPIPGSVFLGGRIDYLDGRPVAALVYRQGEHVVNSFMWPSDASERAPGFAFERGYQTARWTQQGMTHWVISDVNREEFGAIVRAIRAIEPNR